MLKLNKLLIGLFLMQAVMWANADICTVNSAGVEQVFQYDDGNIFIVLDKQTTCNCSQTYRVGFHKDDDEKFFISVALTALTAGKNVTIRAEDNGCSIHGNTAKLTALYLSK